MMTPALAVFLVLALLFGLLWLARRKGLAALSLRLPGMGLTRPAHAARQMRVVERMPLSGQHSLHLVSCVGHLLVISVSPTGCSTLAEFPETFAEALSAAGGVR